MKTGDYNILVPENADPLFLFDQGNALGCGEEVAGMLFIAKIPLTILQTKKSVHFKSIFFK
jgi:hypothetical protein